MAFISGGVGAGMGGIGGGGIGGAIVRGAASSAISQGIGLALGLQDKFNWAAVAAAGVGAGVGNWLGDKIGVRPLSGPGASRELGNVGKNLAVSGASAIANAATRSLIDGSDFGDNIRAALPDVLGSVAGGIIGGAAQYAAATRQAGNVLTARYGENERIEIEAGNREITLSAVTELILSGGTPADVMKFMGSPGMRESLLTLDRTQFGGISAQTSATRVQAYMDAADPISVRQEISPASQEVDEIVVIGQRPGSGGDIAKSAVSGAWGLADSFTQLYDRNPVLAGLATTAIGVALGGAPKTIFKRIGGEMADEAITTGSNIAGSYVAAGVTQLARRKGWVIALSVAGYPTEAHASEIGVAAGAAAGAMVGLAAGAGAGAIAGGAKKARTSLIDRKSFRAEREAFWQNQAVSSSDSFTPENLARMRKGKPPIGSDGHPMELHHAARTPDGPLVPMTRTDHRLGENYRKNHPK